ncbi:actin remodeling regulator NHS-like isoform X3 [Dreissena polymorpha]|nr:actin remodeling regulator NHS-like isoform X3 [Dreissena polymorpha]
MPLGCRNIEPSRLGAHEVPVDGESDRRTVLYTVANNAIVGTLLQLASLVRHADDLFCDIADECQKVLDRTDSISKRIQGVDATISKLDAKQAIIPEGDLKQFTAVTHHHEARHGYDANFFIPTNRPQCVLDLYALCLPNPTRVIRSADLYRKDGLSGSKMFKCWPVLINEKRVRTPDLNLTRSIQRVRSFEKKYKQPRARPKTIHGFDDFNFEEMKKGAVDQHKSAQCLTSPEPPVIVTIDTSGSNFERMQSLRSSGRLQLSTEEKEKRKKRRRTVSGLQNIMGEIEKFDRKKKTAEGQSRTTPRSYSFDDLDDEDEVERDEGLMKYLDEIDGKMEERTGEEKAKKLLNFFCGRRSKSLPRCIKLPSVSRSLSADRRSVKDLNTTYGSSSLSIQSLTSNASSRLSRSAKRSSIIGNKIKSLVTGQKDKPKPRPKSLDIDTLLDTKAKHKSSIEEHERSKSTYSLERKHLLTVPDNLLKKESSSKSSSTLGPGSYYNFESNTLPRATAKKYDFPWETLPKDWTTSVKLREISKRRAKEDRQSSSGNWSQSGTSSNRHSLDSDLRSEEPNKFQSQYSLGKDSGRDSLTLEEENDCVTDGTSTAGYAGDTQSTITGDSVSIGNPKTDFTQLDTEAWIKSLAVRAAQKEAESADKSSSLSRLTRQNILALDLMLAEASPKKKIDDESSVYSVDQEGFYTSFHNDSGLKRSTNTLIDEDEDDACLTPCKDTLSIGSEDSVIHRSALSDKFAGLRRGGNRKKVLSKVTPPLPPDRNLFDSNSQGFDNQTNKPELNSFPSVESSTESEEAVFTRVHDKTNLTHTGFPSLVALSTSDDESSPETKSAGLNSQGLESSVLQHTRSDLGLSNITCASNFSHVSLQSGSYLDDRTHSSPSLKHSSSVLECSKQGCDSPQTGRKEKSKVESSYQSWPRSHKSHTGILKSSEKSVESSRPCKTLNFDPVINLFKEGYQDAVSNTSTITNKFISQ